MFERVCLKDIFNFRVVQFSEKMFERVCLKEIVNFRALGCFKLLKTCLKEFV